MDDNKAKNQTTLEICPQAGSAAITIAGAIDELHKNPDKIRQLLDLLQMPKGTEVRILTTASSSIVR